MITPNDYLGVANLQFDMLTHVNVRGCPIRRPHAHVECSYCDRRFVLDLEVFAETTRQRMQDHANTHRGRP